MQIVDKSRRARIRELNDAFRTGRNPALGRFMLTAGVNALPAKMHAAALHNTASFDAFSGENDPYGEHDFGSFEIDGQRFFFKIDYYDRSLDSGAENPADPATTVRVLTLMLAEEY